MKRYHCWDPHYETPDHGIGFDADTPDHAAAAYVRHSDEEVGAGFESIRVICTRLPGEPAVRVRVTVKMAPEYTTQVLP